MMWFRQMAQLSTTISVSKHINYVTKRNQSKQIHSLTAKRITLAHLIELLDDIHSWLLDKWQHLNCEVLLMKQQWQTYPMPTKLLHSTTKKNNNKHSLIMTQQRLGYMYFVNQLIL